MRFEEILRSKSQSMISSEDLDLIEVYRELIRIATKGGERSQREKVRAAARLLSNADPLEGRYLARLMMEESGSESARAASGMRCAKAFGVETALAEHAMQALNDLGEVARLAKQGSGAGEVRITLFHPIRMMLAQQGTITGMIEEHGQVAAEFKYDGSRFQFHRKGSVARLYSRRLEDMTGALPDVIEYLMAATGRDVILDGEVIAIQDGRPMPFQSVSGGSGGSTM